MKTSSKRSLPRWGSSLLACVLGLAAGACESSPPVRTPELNPQATAALSRLAADQRARAEYLLRERPRTGTRMLVYVDGERVVPTDADASAYEVINPERIATIQLLTGDAAEERAGPGARKGVVWITTKQPAERR